MASSFQFFPHFVIKNEISFLNQDLNHFHKLSLRHKQLHFLILFIILAKHILFLSVFVLLLGSASPVDTQLLVVDDDIAFYYFLFQLVHLYLVHWLDLVVSLEVGFLEVLEFSL